jgi:hypothetical protein
MGFCALSACEIAGLCLMKIDNLRADAERWGWTRSLLVRLMSRLQRHAGLHVYRVGVRPLVRQRPEPNLPRGITLRVAQPEDLLGAAADPELEMPADFVRAALHRGDMAFGAFEGDRLVGYSWRTFSAAPDVDGLWIRVDRPYFCGYRAFTRPSHRGRRIHAAIALFSDGHLLERGYAAEVGFVAITNLASLAVARFLGRQRIGYAGYLKLFGRCIRFRTPAVRKIGAELFAPHGQPWERALSLPAVDQPEAAIRCR